MTTLWKGFRVTPSSMVFALSVVAILGAAAAIPCLAALAPARPISLVGPISAGNLVVVAHGDPAATRLEAYDANGKRRWERQYLGVSFYHGLQACAGLVCAPAFKDGIYIFRASDGKLLAHLLPGTMIGQAATACTPSRVYVASGIMSAGVVIAFDTRRFRQVWTHSFPGRFVRGVLARGNDVEVWTARGYLERPVDESGVVLRESDGRERLLAPLLGLFPEYASVQGLSAAARTRLQALFGTRYIDPGSLARSGGLLALALTEGRSQRLAVIRADDGRTVWQHKAAGLGAIALAGSTVVALVAKAYPGAAGYEMRLDGYDLGTGRSLWSVKLDGRR